MVDVLLRNGKTIQIVEYNDSFADSMALDLFVGVSKEKIIQEREYLLAPGPEEAYSVCALSESIVIGVCTGIRKQWFGERHRIEMVQVVINEQFRKLGLARHMMKVIARHFRNYGIEIVEIGVQSDNEEAFQAYTRIGFKKYGVFQNGLKFGDEYYDDILLSMTLSDLLVE
ncbi:MAG: GNAT family N-acetyltransferase [Candidatus Thorarchaeota archaeon]